MKKPITIADAAKRFGCSRANIYQLIKRHELETVTKTITKVEQVTRKVKTKHVDLGELEKLIGE